MEFLCGGQWMKINIDPRWVLIIIIIVLSILYMNEKGWFAIWLKMEDKEIKLREEWKSYVESYNSQTSKKMHLLSCTHVVFKLIEKACSDYKTAKE